VAAAEDVTAGLGVTSATADAVGVAGAAVGARDAGPEHAVTSSSARKKYARSKVRIDGA